ncbi:hypothetical protein BKA59DRAFT_450217 [Fusarium tricinctum]|uniref:Uncharacterized protein n=1 Tax=Fusarium tricinctum TaxID=61284 RepID=A0A8K0S3I5_9HYPO|nr:hypothetical protein BKA59DRAFT_450217 [Fusarium tricinctum]
MYHDGNKVDAKQATAGKPGQFIEALPRESGRYDAGQKGAPYRVTSENVLSAAVNVSFVDELVLTPSDENVGFSNSATDSCVMYHGEKMTLKALFPRSQRVVANVIFVQIQESGDQPMPPERSLRWRRHVLSLQQGGIRGRFAIKPTAFEVQFKEQFEAWYLHHYMNGQMIYTNVNGVFDMFADESRGSRLYARLYAHIRDHMSRVISDSERKFKEKVELLRHLDVAVSQIISSWRRFNSTLSYLNRRWPSVPFFFTPFIKGILETRPCYQSMWALERKKSKRGVYLASRPLEQVQPSSDRSEHGGVKLEEGAARHKSSAFRPHSWLPFSHHWAIIVCDDLPAVRSISQETHYCGTRSQPLILELTRNADSIDFEEGNSHEPFENHKLLGHIFCPDTEIKQLGILNGPPLLADE